MTNPNNHGVLVGRLSQDKKVFENRDGSKTVLATVAVDNNLSGADQTVKAQLVPVRAFVPKGTDGLGVWDRINVGDQFSTMYRLSLEPYEKDGKTVYPDLTVEVDGFPQFLESKSVTEARAARKAVAASTAATPAVPAEETPEQTIARLQAQIESQATEKAALAELDSPFAGAAA